MKLNKKWIAFSLCALCSVLGLFYIQQRYTSLLQVGVEYQWPVSVSRNVGWVPSDYLEVNFQGNIAPWKGDYVPEVGQEVYLEVSPKPSGVLAVVGASNETPSSGEYIRVKVKKFDGGIVEFQIPFNRVKVDLSKVDSKFYTNYKGILLATLKIKDGYGVLTGVYSKGIPLEMAVPESVADQEEDAKRRIDQIGDESNTAAVGTEEKEAR